MSTPHDRLRPPPAERFAGPEHSIDFGAVLEKLRSEPGPLKGGHNQATIFHSETLRLVLFAFEAGGGLPHHRAPGVVMIQPLRGAIRVATPTQTYALSQGEALVLQPGVPHDVEATSEADMLLSVALTGRRRDSEDRPGKE